MGLLELLGLGSSPVPRRTVRPRRQEGPFSRYQIRNKGGQTICMKEGCLSTPSPIAREITKTQAAANIFFHWLYNVSQPMPEIVLNNQEVGNARSSCTRAPVGNRRCRIELQRDTKFQESVRIHEYAHGIDPSNLGPFHEAGALKESFADISAHAFNHLFRKKSGWSIGGRRDVTHPTTMNSIKRAPVTEDRGEIHANSRIPTSAYRLAVRTEPYSEAKIARIWFAAMKQAGQDETFRTFADKTVRIAVGCKNLKLAHALRQAWLDVGIYSTVRLYY